MPWTPGAGGESHAGKAAYDNPRGARTEEAQRTCPQWFLRSPFVQSVWTHLKDYREGRIGNVMRLPAPLLFYLRELDTAVNCAKEYWEGRLTDG